MSSNKFIPTQKKKHKESKAIMAVKSERQSRSRQRICQRPHTPVHQQQLEQIKTQYLNHQHDITIDRDTVLKINRLATRRNLHKREHSWPPTTIDNAAPPATSTPEKLNAFEKNGRSLRQEQHIRSTSIDNALQFDESVCKRHGIDVIREKFNSPTRIIEPSPQEVRQRRQKQRKTQQQRQQQQSQSQLENTCRTKTEIGADTCEAEHAVTTTKPKQMINLVKHEELLRKNLANKSSTLMDTATVQRSNEESDLRKTKHKQFVTSTGINEEEHCVAEIQKEDQLFQATTKPLLKGFSHPETKAADEDIGLVEPKRLFFEHLSTDKKWHSVENLSKEESLQPSAKYKPLGSIKRQAYSLERGREARHHTQLPPQKPRGTPKLQRRSMKLATEIQISYDNDAQQHNIQVQALNQPKQIPATKPLSNTLCGSPDDLEHIPLPAIPARSSKIVEIATETDADLNSDANVQSLKDQQIYDDSCIFLRSLDLQDNTVAYIPAAITIVPSPTEKIMQRWLDSANLKANIKGVNDTEEIKTTATKACHELQNKNENVISSDSVKSVTIPEGIKPQQQQQSVKNKDEQSTEAETFVTRLPTTPNGIQVARQTSDNTKCRTQTSIADNKQPLIHECSHQARPPGVIRTNATPTDCNKVAQKGDKLLQKGVYYTDGEYVYGPYDALNGTPLADVTIRSWQAEQQAKSQQLHQHAEIKKDIEAETKSQHKNEIANLTAKYENIQKSINEHLRQIDAYIENAKVALKSTLEKGTECSQIATPYDHPPDNLKAQLQWQQPAAEVVRNETETPLKEILRKITNVMQEANPLYRNQKANQQAHHPQQKQQFCKDSPQDAAEEENVPIVEKVLMDLNMLTKHLSEFDKSTSAELKPIMKQLDLQFGKRPTATEAAHVFITDESTNNEKQTEAGKNQEKSKTIRPITTHTPSPPPPPPLLLLTEKTPDPKLSTIPTPEKRTQHVLDTQLLASDKLITAQIQRSKQQELPPPHQPFSKATTKLSKPEPKENQTTKTASAAAKDKNKNFVCDFITTRHEQEQLVEQVIDTLDKMENESKEKLVSTHVPVHADEQITSNLNQQPPSSSKLPATIDSTNALQQDVVVMQNCNISVSPDAFGTSTSNHEHLANSTKGNESQLKLHIKDTADKKPDKQFQKYDNPTTPPPPPEHANDVVSIQKDNKNSRDQKQKHEKHAAAQHQLSDDDKHIKIQEQEEGSSNHSSGSELSNTNKSCYELPSPYVTARQISWEDVLSSAIAHTQQEGENRAATPTSVLTKTRDIIKPKHQIEISQICIKSPVILDKCVETTSNLTAMKPVVTSGHVEMQSTTAPKPGKHTGQQPHQTLKKQSTVSEAKYKAGGRELFKPRSTSVSPTRLCNFKMPENEAANARRELMESIRKYPAPFAEPHLSKRNTSPLSVRKSVMVCQKRSTSISPQRSNRTLTASPHTYDDLAIRKYPAPLAEPSVPTRAASPFGLNPVDLFSITKATASGLELENDGEQEARPTSPTRKYPPALIEPHVPTRAASPFGLNAVETKYLHKSHHRSPSPARSCHTHRHHYSAHEASLLKLSSTTGDKCKKAVVYVPQVEGHNIGLLVRSKTPASFFPTDAVHAAPSHAQEMTSATKTPQDYATFTTRDITGKLNCSSNNMGRGDDDDDDDDDDAASSDELQRINTIGLTKQGKQPNMRNLDTTVTTTSTATATATMAHHLHQQHRPQMHSCVKHHLQNQEQCSGGYASGVVDGGGGGSGSGQHMAVDIIPLPTSVINRSFDNVSPRPYVSIEGYKRVAWPPPSEERIVREFTPQPQTQYQPAPAYNQQYQPTAATAAANASSAPPTQGPIYNNVQHNTNNLKREIDSPYKQNPNQNDYEAFPPQTPETPIILKDKQFSRLPSQEPNPANAVSYQQYQQQPQNQSMLQQHHSNQPVFSPEQNNQLQQHQYYKNLNQSVAYVQQQQQQQHQMQTEHPHHQASGWKPIYPPQTKPGHLCTAQNDVRGTTPSRNPPDFQPQYQNYQQLPTNQQQQYRAPSYDNYQQQQQQQQQQQYPPQPQYQNQTPQTSQNLYQQPPQAGSYNQQPAWVQQQAGVPQQPQQQYQQPPWAQPPQQQQQQYQPQQQQAQYQNPLNQYNQAPHQYQQPQQPQQQYPLQQNQFVPQTNQQQFNSYSQPQQQQHTVSHDQVDQQQHQHYPAHLAQDQRGASPGIITLRKETPITQKPAPVYTSQPAAIRFRGGSSMRGDLKWPPPEYKEAAIKENEERRKLALGPVCRPRKVHRDYTSFFAKNALSHHYPSYKVPPGTQHMIN